MQFFPLVLKLKLPVHNWDQYAILPMVTLLRAGLQVLRQDVSGWLHLQETTKRRRNREMPLAPFAWTSILLLV